MNININTIIEGVDFYDDDEFFINDCWYRTKDNRKCDYCDLKFKCYTKSHDMKKFVTASGTYPIIMGDYNET